MPIFMNMYEVLTHQYDCNDIAIFQFASCTTALSAINRCRSNKLIHLFEHVLCDAAWFVVLRLYYGQPCMASELIQESRFKMFYYKLRYPYGTDQAGLRVS